MAGARGFNAQASRLIEAICQPLCLNNFRDPTIANRNHQALQSPYGRTGISSKALKQVKSSPRWVSFSPLSFILNKFKWILHGMGFFLGNSFPITG
jgi:hypothetical protein